MSITGCPRTVNNAWVSTRNCSHGKSKLIWKLSHVKVSFILKWWDFWVSSEMAWLAWESTTSSLHGLVCLLGSPARKECGELIISGELLKVAKVPILLFPPLQYSHARTVLNALRNHNFIQLFLWKPSYSCISTQNQNFTHLLYFSPLPCTLGFFQVNCCIIIAIIFPH